MYLAMSGRAIDDLISQAALSVIVINNNHGASCSSQLVALLGRRIPVITDLLIQQDASLSSWHCPCHDPTHFQFSGCPCPGEWKVFPSKWIQADSGCKLYGSQLFLHLALELLSGCV